MEKHLIFEKQQWHVQEEEPFYSDPQKALLVKGGKLFFVGFAGDFLHNTFLQLFSIQGHKRQHQKTVGHAKYVKEDIRLKCCFLLLPDRSSNV